MFFLFLVTHLPQFVHTFSHVLLIELDLGISILKFHDFINISRIYHVRNLVHRMSFRRTFWNSTYVNVDALLHWICCFKCMVSRVHEVCHTLVALRRLMCSLKRCWNTVPDRKAPRLIFLILLNHFLSFFLQYFILIALGEAHGQNLIFDIVGEILLRSGRTAWDWSIVATNGDGLVWGEIVLELMVRFEVGRVGNRCVRTVTGCMVCSVLLCSLFPFLCLNVNDRIFLSFSV